MFSVNFSLAGNFMKKFVSLVFYILISGACPAQQAAQYQAAAQMYNSAAARCNNPTGAACYRLHASHYSCLVAQLAGGGSCGNETTCTASCEASGSAGTTAGSKATNNIINGIQLGTQLLSLFHSNDSQPTPAGPTPEELAAAAKQQQINNDAANILNAANSLVDANAPLNGVFAPPPNSTSEVSALLSDAPSAPDSTSTVTSLLDGSSDRNAATANALAGLLDSDSQADQPVSPLLTASLTAQPSIPAGLIPQNPQVNAALQDSVDQPDPSQTGLLGGMLQSAGQEMKDSLSGMVTSAKTLASDLMNDPVVQWATSDKGSLTIAPLPVQGDLADTATNKVYGQAVVGFGDLLKGMAAGPEGFAKGLYSYGANMINEMGADLGLANDTVFNLP
jgi:hypothetical protein